MARRTNIEHPPKDDELGEPSEVTPPPMDGGSPGIPSDVPATLTPRREVADTPKVKVKRYRVVNGGSVMYDGCRTHLRAGKEVDDTTYDLVLLEKQGIRLEELEPEMR